MYPDRKLAKDKYDQVLIERILRLWERMYPVFESSTASHRLRADAFELAVLALCVRVTKTQSRHGHICVSLNVKVVERFLAKLERYRKRAKRAWLASAAEEVYWDYQTRWRKLLVWIHLHLLFCHCNRPKAASRSRDKRGYVKHCLALVRDGLRQERIPPPAEKDLRRLVRLAMRYVSRERTYVTLGSLLHGGPSAQRYLTKFVMERLSTNQEKENS